MAQPTYAGYDKLRGNMLESFFRPTIISPMRNLKNLTNLVEMLGLSVKIIQRSY